MFQEEGYYFVTSRCLQGRLLLRPSAEVNDVVGGVLARAVQQSAGTVKLYAFTFASNRFHLLVWALPQTGEEEASVAPQAAASKEPMKERRPREDQAELLRRTFDFDVFA